MVLRLQSDMTGLPIKGFDGRFAFEAVDHGDDDLSVVRGFGLLYENQVTIHNPRFNHTLTAHPQHEIRAVCGEARRNRKAVLNVLFRENRRACGNAADNRNLNDIRNRLQGRAVCPCLPRRRGRHLARGNMTEGLLRIDDHQGSRLGRILNQVALSDKTFDILMRR